LAVDPLDLGSFDDVAPVGFALVGPDGVIRAANEVFESLTGRTAEDLAERRLSDLLTVGGRIYFETHLRPMLLVEGAVRQIALDLVHSGGDRVPVLLSALLVRHDDGSPRLLRVAVFDATERRAYEQEVLAARQRAEEAASTARELARTLQRSLMPERPPLVEGLELAAAYHPAGDGVMLGGDFYDVFQVAESTWVVLLGDVCGKGPAAAAVTALARYTLRASLVTTSEPDLALRVLHDVLLLESEPRFCTLAVLVLTRQGDGWSGVHSTGGHALPLLRRADGSITTVGSAGSLVGAFDDPEFPRTRFALGPGDLLLMFTDGVTEARNASGMFEEPRVVDALAGGGSAVAVVGNLMDSVLAFQGGVPRDDVAVVGLRVA
jgi:sigma-B regulation protein RsbU (phosphoserine phosphatase)